MSSKRGRSLKYTSDEEKKQAMKEHRRQYKNRNKENICNYNIKYYNDNKEKMKNQITETNKIRSLIQCEHGNIKNKCLECSGINCSICNNIYRKYYIKKHIMLCEKKKINI